MQEKLTYIGEGNDKVLLAFNLNVMAEIQGVWGDTPSWLALIEDRAKKRHGEPDMDALLKGFTFMVNEGIDIENDEAEPDAPQKKPFTQRQVGRLVTKFGIGNVTASMKNSIANSVDTGEKSKNELSTTKTTTKA